MEHALDIDDHGTPLCPGANHCAKIFHPQADVFAMCDKKDECIGPLDGIHRLQGDACLTLE